MDYVINPTFIITFLFIIFDKFNGFYEGFLDYISTISIIAALLIIIYKNPIYSVLNLIMLFSSISCYLIFVNIKFIGISYLLVYVGAVSILFLFILMLLNIRVSELVSDTNNNVPLGFLALIIIYLPLNELLPSSKDIFGYVSSNKDDYQNSHYISAANWDSNLIDFSDIASLGSVMYSNYSIWLILTSIILLLAMVGSIVITIKQ